VNDALGEPSQEPTKLRPLTIGSWDDFLSAATQPVLVDFWAAWCPPCVQTHEILDELTDEYRDVVIFGAVNVSHDPELASRYSVNSVPTLIIFVDGEPVRRLVGARPKRHLQRELSAYSRSD
jgi:thioredoxin 1